jgi:lipoprotein-anchoring transpeptidase ErfK/SrfK
MLKTIKLGLCLSLLTPLSMGASAAAAAAPPAQTSGTPSAAEQNAGSLSDPKAIEAAQPSDANTTPSRELLVRVEVLLDRAHFSPGEIDGKSGDNLNQAIAAYWQAHGLGGGSAIDADLLKALLGTDHQPVLQTYTITADDEKGPFIGKAPKDFRALAKLKHIGYANPQELLAEKFHMSESLLGELNPKADFSKAGTTITVAQPGNGELPQVARVEVDKGQNQIRAFDQANKIVAVFPATVGSTYRPAPSGKAEVVSVAPDPTYTYDPSRLTFGPKHAGKLTIAAGPNNPVGSTWIALSIATYGIHGTPDPELVGKTASHGCVRLTNWDAAALGKAVKKGTPVDFVGQEKPKPSQAEAKK